MKQFYLLLMATALYAVSNAQIEGASTLYGYRQPVMPGMVRVDETGREAPRKQQYNYFIYLASSSKVTPVEIWINGQSYPVTTTSVSSSPVKYTNPTSGDNKPSVLVPKTTKNVVQLNPAGDKLQKPSQKGKTLSAKNELVVLYRSNGKLYYKTLSNFSELKPVAMQ